MKQRVTIEQVKELNSDQENMLLGLWKPELGDWVYDKEMDEIGVICGTEGKTPEVIHVTWYYGGDSVITLKGKTLPLFSIGQMIEGLYNCHTCVTIEVGTQGFFATVKGGVSNKNTKEELCNTLWGSTKRMLDVMFSLKNHS